ncbi:hypothetical protein BJP48_30310 [Paenibacillus odorifer]|uniref:hypothetical protein n=1 Tax=Paenibacillus sp. FSL L8-0499 TaxID=2975334 RepID=UPI00096D211E|nr:hypothetical protein BJP48_30310 [Paenibacillus odorifer]
MYVDRTPELNENIDRILELAKIAKSKGTFEGTLKRVYLMNKVKQYRMEQRKKAAIAVAARERLFEN